MVSKLAENVTGAQMVEWLLLFFLVGFFIYKEWPELRARVSSGVLKEKKVQEDSDTLSGKIDRLEEGQKEINDKLDRDYRRLNVLERWQRRAQMLDAESAEERALMMKGMIACIDGMHQLGANGETTKVKAELSDFLIRTSHNKGGDEA